MLSTEVLPARRDETGVFRLAYVSRSCCDLSRSEVEQLAAASADAGFPTGRCGAVLLGPMAAGGSGGPGAQEVARAFGAAARLHLADGLGGPVAADVLAGVLESIRSDPLGIPGEHISSALAGC
ncbi:hypothetical protein SAMN05444722_3408 [Rhodovulum sp. ES.010]|nr:hypothetical protein [Rhodovulum sp. ES.010]SIO54759.1 hypothetical protein SAMN05444722_3408 [Rhodovulum sp. ES.010]